MANTYTLKFEYEGFRITQIIEQSGGQGAFTANLKPGALVDGKHLQSSKQEGSTSDAPVTGAGGADERSVGSKPVPPPPGKGGSGADDSSIGSGGLPLGGAGNPITIIGPFIVMSPREKKLKPEEPNEPISN